MSATLKISLNWELYSVEEDTTAVVSGGVAMQFTVNPSLLAS